MKTKLRPCIQRFVDDYIRSEYMQNLSSANESEGFGPGLDRFARCHDAAEFGAYGSTHSEIINDWREGLDEYIDFRIHRGTRQRRRNSDAIFPERFRDSILAYFDEVELFHEAQGTLHEEIG